MRHDFKLQSATVYQLKNQSFPWGFLIHHVYRALSQPPTLIEKRILVAKSNTFPFMLVLRM